MCTTPSAIVFVFALADQLEPITAYRVYDGAAVPQHLLAPSVVFIRLCDPSRADRCVVSGGGVTGEVELPSVALPQLPITQALD